MSLDRSLKTHGGLAGHRNVLTRAERIEKLAAKSLFDPQAGNPMGLPKVGNRKVVTGGKSVKKDAAAAVDATGAPAPAAAPVAVAAAPAADKKKKKK